MLGTMRIGSSSSSSRSASARHPAATTGIARVPPTILVAKAATSPPCARGVVIAARASAPRSAGPYGAAPSFPTPTEAPTSPRANAADASVAPAAASTEPTVEELMDPGAPVLREDTPLRDAARLFLTTGAQSAPVVDAAGVLVGVLSESDLILKSSGVPSDDHWLLPPVYVGVLDATLALRDERAWRAEVDKILARDVGHAMTRGGGQVGKGGGKGNNTGGKAALLVTAAPFEAVGVAAGRMAHHHVNMLPVVDGGGRVVGTISRHDVLRGLYATQSPTL